MQFQLRPLCVYSVTRHAEERAEETFGMLYFADVTTLEGELHSEIERLLITDALPDAWTYPLIQPHLLQHAMELGYNLHIPDTL